MKFIAIHGGAGKRSDKSIRSKALEAIVKALEAGIETLSNGSALDAVIASVVSMEDSPYLNAGIGSTVNLIGEVEMDACVATEDSIGAIAGTKIARNPILLAKRVMDTDHLIIAGRGADMLAKIYGMAVDSNSFFITPRVHRLWKAAMYELLEGDVPEDLKDLKPIVERYINNIYPKVKEYISYYSQYITLADTVGAVAFDGEHLAAATSTGGVFLKLPGRVGDSPIFGAGTYVGNGIAISASGVGEQIIKTSLAKVISTLYTYGLPIDDAVESGMKLASKSFERPSMGVIAVSEEGISIHHTTEAFVAGYAILDGSEIVEKKVSDVWE